MSQSALQPDNPADSLEAKLPTVRVRKLAAVPPNPLEAAA
jgi:hypothetical protein